MADRELTPNERAGTFIQHRNNGSEGIIKFKNIGGYQIYCSTNDKDKFIPFNKLKEYVVIE